MENKVIDITAHKKYRRPTLWLPDSPDCQVYDCKKMFRKMRRERGRDFFRERLRRQLQRRSEQCPEFYEDEF